MTMINQNNYEEYMMLLADGELNAADTKELYAFVKANPALEAELKAYMGTRISTNTQIEMPNKAALLKKVPTTRIGFWPKYKNYAVAAGLVLFLSIGLYRFNNSKSNNLLTNTNTAPTQPSTPTIKAPNTTNVPANQQITQPLNPSPVAVNTTPNKKTPVAHQKSPVLSVPNTNIYTIQSQSPQIARVQNSQQPDSSLKTAVKVSETKPESIDFPENMDNIIKAIEDLPPSYPPTELATQPSLSCSL